MKRTPALLSLVSNRVGREQLSSPLVLCATSPVSGNSSASFRNCILMDSLRGLWLTGEKLGEPGAIVVAEKLVRVPDLNRPRQNRVDSFCYKENGDVVRYHPWSMTPHRMPSAVCAST